MSRRKYPLSKEALAKVKEDLKAAKKTVQKECSGIHKVWDVKRKKLQSDRSKFDKDYNKSVREAAKLLRDRKQAYYKNYDNTRRLHEKEITEKMKPFNKEVTKLKKILTHNNESKWFIERKKREALREKEKITEAKRELEETKRHLKKMNYSDDQLKFMDKSRPAFNRTKKSFVMYKKGYIKDSEKTLCTPVIVTLEIPDGTKRVCGDDIEMNVAKIRVAKAKVVKINYLHGVDVGEETKRTAYGANNGNDFPYKLNNTVTPENDFNSDKDHVCASGIHGYLSMKAAIDHRS